MNLEKLAQLAGVSLGTVSKAFSGSHEIGEQTRNRIFELAKEHNCFEKYYKAKREKKVIAVICPELESSYYCSIVSRIESELNRQGAMMFLALSGFNAKKEAEIVSYLISSKSADGILIVAASSRVRFNKDVPIVAVNTKRDLSEVDCINVAFKDTIIEAIKYLKDCGHKKIAYIGEMHTKAKLNMFLNAILKKHVLKKQAKRQRKKFLRWKISPPPYFARTITLRSVRLRRLKNTAKASPTIFRL